MECCFPLTKAGLTEAWQESQAAWQKGTCEGVGACCKLSVKQGCSALGCIPYRCLTGIYQCLAACGACCAATACICPLGNNNSDSDPCTPAYQCFMVMKNCCVLCSLSEGQACWQCVRVPCNIFCSGACSPWQNEIDLKIALKEQSALADA